MKEGVWLYIASTSGNSEEACVTFLHPGPLVAHLEGLVLQLGPASLFELNVVLKQAKRGDEEVLKNKIRA